MSELEQPKLLTLERLNDRIDGLERYYDEVIEANDLNVNIQLEGIKAMLKKLEALI